MWPAGPSRDGPRDSPRSRDSPLESDSFKRTPKSPPSCTTTTTTRSPSKMSMTLDMGASHSPSPSVESNHNNNVIDRKIGKTYHQKRSGFKSSLSGDHGVNGTSSAHVQVYKEGSISLKPTLGDGEQKVSLQDPQKQKYNVSVAFKTPKLHYSNQLYIYPYYVVTFSESAQSLLQADVAPSLERQIKYCNVFYFDANKKPETEEEEEEEEWTECYEEVHHTVITETKTEHAVAFHRGEDSHAKQTVVTHDPLLPAEAESRTGIPKTPNTSNTVSMNMNTKKSGNNANTPNSGKNASTPNLDEISQNQRRKGSTSNQKDHNADLNSCSSQVDSALTSSQLTSSQVNSASTSTSTSTSTSVVNSAPFASKRGGRRK